MSINKRFEKSDYKNIADKYYYFADLLKKRNNSVESIMEQKDSPKRLDTPIASRTPEVGQQWVFFCFLCFNIKKCQLSIVTLIAFLSTKPT